MIKTWEGLPWIAKVILQLFLGYLVSIIYRIIKLTQKVELKTVIGLILSFFAIGWWIDFVTVLLSGKIYILA